MMRININLLLLSLILMAGNGYAQIEPQVSSYYMLRGLRNPAFLAAGKNQIGITLLHRSQWADIENSPSTEILSLETYLRRTLGMGVYILADNLGFEQINTMELHLSKDVSIENLKISVGMGFGAIVRTLKGSNLVYQSPDPNSIETDQNEVVPDLSIGTLITYKELQVSFSFKHLIFSSLGNDFFHVPWHVYSELSYPIPVSSKVMIRPSLLIRSVGWNTSFKFAARGTLSDRYHLGISWEEGNNLNFNLGLQVNPFISVNMLFERIIKGQLDASNNSFEVGLEYLIIRPDRKLKSPRYL